MRSTTFLCVLFASVIAKFVHSSCIVEVDNETSGDIECIVQYTDYNDYYNKLQDYRIFIDSESLKIAF